MGDVHEQNATTGKWGVRSSTQTTDSSGNPAGNVVVSVVGGLTRNREFATVTTRQSVTWAEGFGPKYNIEITLAPDGEAYVCFDAPNDAVANDWLADDGSSSTDAMRHYIADETLKPQGNKFTLPGVELRRLDIIRVSGTITIAYVEAE